MVKKFIAGLVIVLTFISIFPLLKSGLPPTHDGEYHVIRFYEFHRTLSDGNIYPRWAPDLNHGFGVPLFNFVYPLPNYVASSFHLLGISFIDSFKLNMVFASILGAIFIYLWVKEFFGDLPGLVSSVFYTFSPYHFLDIYVRGSVGEVWALGLFPMFLWGISKYFKEKKIKFAIFSSLSLALIIFSHNILAFMFFPFAVSFIVFLILQEKKKRFLVINSFMIMFLGLGLSSVFWLPALLEKQFVRGLEVFDYSFHFPQLYELIIPSWGSGFSGGNLSTQLSFQIGIANLIAIFLSLITTWFLRKDKERIRLDFFFLLWFILIFLLMLEISMPIWQYVPFMDYFQFPWRFLSLEILIASFLAGSVVSVFQNASSAYLWKNFVFAIFMIVLSFGLGIGYTNVAYYHQRTDGYYIQRPNFIDGTNSPGNAFNTIWFKDINKREKEKISLNKEEIKSKEIKSTNYIFEVDSASDRKVIVNTAYFPQWEVFVSGEKKKIEITDKGLFSFDISKGKHTINIKFEDTFVRKLSSILFFLSFLFILFRIPFFATIKR